MGQENHREEIWSTTRDAKYMAADNPSCSDRNVVYALICRQCDKTVYVGETERMLNERIDEHLRTYANKLGNLSLDILKVISKNN